MKDDKQEWQDKMWRHYLMNRMAKMMAIDRVRKLAFENACWDWDDNIPVAWALELAKKWELTDER